MNLEFKQLGGTSFLPVALLLALPSAAGATRSGQPNVIISSFPRISAISFPAYPGNASSNFNLVYEAAKSG